MFSLGANLLHQVDLIIMINDLLLLLKNYEGLRAYLEISMLLYKQSAGLKQKLV